MDKAVSTHSRPKAAAHHHLLLALLLRCFNTQPPEGGCFKMYLGHFFPVKFQHTAARRRLHTNKFVSIKKWKFQHTAARRRLPITFTVGAEGLMFQHTAARRRLQQISLKLTPDVAVSTHSRPKAAAVGRKHNLAMCIVSTHSRPKAAASTSYRFATSMNVSTHSRPKAAAPYIKR